MSQSPPSPPAAGQNGGQPAFVPDAASLAGAKKNLVLSRWLGKTSAFFFILAALCVGDALQTLVRYEFNRIDIIPGEQLAVSGMMPYGVPTHKDLQVELVDLPGLAFEPVETYKGFWMGGNMWRANVAASPDIASLHADEPSPWAGKATIVDILLVPKEPAATATPEGGPPREREWVPGDQNPAQIYTIYVWPTAAARQAADLSFSRRLTGLPAFGLGFAMLGLALLAGVGNWFMFGRAESGLARHGIYVIHGIKAVEPTIPAGPLAQKGKGKQAKIPRDKKAAFAHAKNYGFVKGSKVALLDGSWQKQAIGTVVEIEKIKAFAVFSAHGVAPRYGWLVSFTSEDQP